MWRGGWEVGGLRDGWISWCGCGVVYIDGWVAVYMRDFVPWASSGL